MICEPWQVVIVPFPFTDRAQTKRRPALVLSQTRFNRRGHSILSMITSTGHEPWPGDTPLTDLASAGLPHPCLVRLKIFTLDNRFILRRIGILAAADRKRLASELAAHLVVRA